MARKNVIIGSLALALGAIGLLGYEWQSVIPVSGPSQREYAVYSAFLHNLAADALFQRKRLAVMSRTSTVGLPYYQGPPYSPPTPSGLKIAAIDASFADFSDFCGSCGKDFVRKNLNSWPLHQSSEFLLVGAARPERPADNSSAVALSRVGFNLWRNRAVLTFTADCSDQASFLMCIAIGQAYLKIENGQWTVDRMLATTH